MRVFLSEYLTSGAFTGGADEKATLAVEGAAMLRALAADAAALPGARVTVTWDVALGPFDVPGIEVRVIRSPDHERELFRRLAAESDATLVIAPEFDGLLADRSRLVADSGGRSVGSTPEAITLCGDKLALAAHLSRAGVPTIDTRPCDFAELATALPGPLEGFLVKPRHGAGSIGLFRIRNHGELATAQAAYAAGPLCGGPVVQPFVPGAALSVAAIVSPSGIELFPVARQHLAGDDRPHYAGGSIPAETGFDDAVADLARQALAAVPGLYGYVGLDLILPDEAHPIVVEINPRLTSSYLGYRALAAGNLAARILAPDVPRLPARWRPGPVAFLHDGAVSP